MKFPGYVTFSHAILLILNILTDLISVGHAQMIVRERFNEEEIDCPSPTDPTVITARELSIPWGDPFRAFKTTPKGLVVAPSSIPKAGYGMFSENFIKRFTWLGEYEGEIVPMDREDDISWYAWTIHRSGDDSYFVDARNIPTSSSLRWINCAHNTTAQNVNVHECRGRVYYMTCRDIWPGQELLVYYGDDYAETLGLKNKS